MGNITYSYPKLFDGDIGFWIFIGDFQGQNNTVLNMVVAILKGKAVASILSLEI